jgi:hypothetical protein
VGETNLVAKILDSLRMPRENHNRGGIRRPELEPTFQGDLQPIVNREDERRKRIFESAGADR